MCNVSQGLIEKGIEKGRAEGKAEALALLDEAVRYTKEHNATLQQLLDKGYPIEIAEMAIRYA
ncbi:MAG: hypothetical protein ACI4D8_03225 [Wujia sp.]